MKRISGHQSSVDRGLSSNISSHRRENSSHAGPSQPAQAGASIQDLPDELLRIIVAQLSPWDLVATRQTSSKLRGCVNEFIANRDSFGAFLASQFKAPRVQTPAGVAPESDPQIEAYKASIAQAITGDDNSYLQNNQKFLQGLQALEVHQNGGFELGNNTSFVWYKNNLWACGENGNGQLGLRDRENRNTFARIGGFGDPPWGTAVILGVAAGGSHTVVWTTVGLFVCGYNMNGRLGLGPGVPEMIVDIFTRVGGDGPAPWGDAVILSVAAGNYHTIVWTTVGLFVCGVNVVGLLGLGDYVDRNTFVRVGGFGDPPWGTAAILGVAAGNYHTIVWTTVGLFVCGGNAWGQLGLGPNALDAQNTFTRVGGFGDPPWGTAAILGVAAGFRYTVVWTTVGLFVSGYNDKGQSGLGLAAPETVYTFTRVGGTGQPPWGTAAILGVAAGFRYTVVWTTVGLFVCGDHDHGQLGLGSNTPCEVHTFTRVVDNRTGRPPWGEAVILGVAAGEAHTAVWTTDGLFVCGLHHRGQLGLGPAAAKTVHTFTRVPGYLLGKMIYDCMQSNSTVQT